MAKVTESQLKELHAKVASGDISREALQVFLDSSGRVNLEGLSSTFTVDIRGRTVTCAWIPPNYFDHDPTCQQVMDEIARRNLCCPCHKLAIRIFKQIRDEMRDHPSFAIDGFVWQEREFSNKRVGFVFANGDHILPYNTTVDDSSPREYRFLVIVSQ